MDRLRPAETTPTGAFQYCLPIRIRMADTDAQGIVYHANYLTLCEAARNEYMRDQELHYSAVTGAGLEMAVSAAHVKYHAPARFDDVVEVWVRVSQLKRVSMTFAYELRRRADDTLLTTADVELACINRETRRPARIPAVIGEGLRAFEGTRMEDLARRKASV